MKVESGRLTKQNFWRHTFTKSLNVRGRLALCYVMFFVGDDDVVILEDMSTFCGLESSECCDWLNLFMRRGFMRPETQWEGRSL